MLRLPRDPGCFSGARRECDHCSQWVSADAFFASEGSSWSHHPVTSDHSHGSACGKMACCAGRPPVAMRVRPLLHDGIMHTLPLGIRLSAAARDLYASEGPDGMSIRRLSKRTGLCPSALYKFYRSRAALLKTVAFGAWMSFIDDLRRHEDLNPAGARLSALTRDALDFAVANAHLWKFHRSRSAPSSRPL